MLRMHFDPKWQNMLNPFVDEDTSEVITGHVSGRSTDITEIITGDQNAILLAGAPGIGKSSLIRYLQRPPGAGWTWRNELSGLPNRFKLNEIHFVQIDLTPLEDAEDPDTFLTAFIAQCARALFSVSAPEGLLSSAQPDLKELRKLLRHIGNEHPDTHYFVMLDTIRRLMQPDKRSFFPQTVAQTPQEHALALLDHCGAIRTLVDLIDEFRNFGVILSIESLPRPNIGHQFTHISADLARFTTMTLQTFTWEDVTAFLAQPPKNFGPVWANWSQELHISPFFSQAEQAWLRTQAGTHPYLLHQFCYHTFDFKREHACIHDSWIELSDSDKKQLIEWLHERLNTFLANTWKRLQQALEISSPETRSNFQEFLKLLTQQSGNVVINTEIWDQFGPELRYILYSEGILRYDPLQPIYYPGSTLRNYLIHKAEENTQSGPPAAPSQPPVTGHKLAISIPGKQPDSLSLTELEFRLVKTLLQQPDSCTTEELMKGAWGRLIERSAFTQRLFQLRKKLKDRCGGIEIIENRYGGHYLLIHPEWFHWE